MSTFVTSLGAACLSFALAALGCNGDTERSDSAPTAPDRWLGSEPHVSVHGEIDGERVDLELDAEAVAQPQRVFCKRGYIVPSVEDPSTWGQGTLPELEVTVRVVVGGVEREYEIELLHQDFARLKAGAELTIAAPLADEALPPEGSVQLELQWQWEEGNRLVDFEENAASGNVVVGDISGTPGEDGLVIPDGTGAIGAFFDSRYGGGSLAGSFSVPCGENEVE